MEARIQLQSENPTHQASVNVDGNQHSHSKTIQRSQVPSVNAGTSDSTFQELNGNNQWQEALCLQYELAAEA